MGNDDWILRGRLGDKVLLENGRTGTVLYSSPEVRRSRLTGKWLRFRLVVIADDDGCSHSEKDELIRYYTDKRHQSL